MYLSTLLVALLSSRGVVPLPAPEKTYPEVIPGPGLPTLAELGLTSIDLYMMKPDLSILLLFPIYRTEETDYYSSSFASCDSSKAF
jgi:hypothetical protein